MLFEINSPRQIAQIRVEVYVVFRKSTIDPDKGGTTDPDKKPDLPTLELTKLTVQVGEKLQELTPVQEQLEGTFAQYPISNVVIAGARFPSASMEIKNVSLGDQLLLDNEQQGTIQIARTNGEGSRNYQLVVNSAQPKLAYLHKGADGRAVGFSGV